MTPFVSASGVHKSYTVGSHALHVLRDVNLDVDAGEMLAGYHVLAVAADAGPLEVRRQRRHLG